jgi:ABC-type phosphate transport system ATPase subunit
VLGDSNIIFFINVLQKSIVYNVKCVVIARALVNQPSIILADDPCAYFDTQNSKIIPELNPEAEQRYITDDRNSVS